MSSKFSGIELTLLKVIKERAIRTKENSQFPPKSSSGARVSWLLDIRRLFLNSDDLDMVTDVFWNYMEARLPFQIGGLEAGAVPLIGALIIKAKQRGHNVNGFFVRKSRKKSGLCQQIEGELVNQPIVVVDDLVNSGGSFRRVKSALEDEGYAIRDYFVFVDFERTKFKEYVKDNNLNFIAPFTTSDLGLIVHDRKSYYPDKETLSIQWMFSPPNPTYVFVVPKSTPALDNDAIYYGADNGIFYAVDQSTGEMLWEFQTGESLKGILSSPVIYDNGVIFGAYDGTVYNLNRRSGAIIWRYDAADAVGSSPALAEDMGLVFIGLEQNVFDNKGSIVALDLNTGMRIWEHVVREYLHATPVYCLEKGIVVVGTNDKNVLCLNALDGEVKWIFEMEGELKAAVTFDLKRNQVIAPSFDWNCYAIDIDNGVGNVLFTGNHVFYSTALVVEDRLYVGTCGKTLYVFDLVNKSLIRKLDTLGRIMSHPSFIEGKVYFGCNDGCIREIDQDGNLIGGLYLPERSLTQIVHQPESQNFYAVTAGNHLVCMGSI